MSTTPHDSARLPTLWVVTRDLGMVSQVWMLRQILGFTRLRPVILCWNDHLPGGLPEESAALGARRITRHVIPLPAYEDRGMARWTNRLARLGSRNFLAASRAEVRVLEDLARQDPPDVVLAHFGHVGLRVLPVAERLGVPVVCHFHGLDLSSSLRNPWYRTSLWHHVDRFAALITVGTRQRDELRPHVARPEAVHVIPCGVPMDAFFPMSGPDPDPPCFAVVSRLVPQKGVDYCLRAFAALPRGTAVLQIVGDGPERGALETLARELGIADEVRFRGAQRPEVVRAVLGCSTALLQHSLDAADGWYEGFGVTVAEASAMAVPTIASRCGGLMDQVTDGETGLLVPQRDVAALAAAMQRFLHEPKLRNRLGQAARVRTGRDFDLPGQVAQLETVLLNQVRGQVREGMQDRAAGAGAA